MVTQNEVKVNVQAVLSHVHIKLTIIIFIQSIIIEVMSYLF